MWGCDLGSWGNGIFPGRIFFMLAWLLYIALTIYVAMRIFRTRTPNTDTRSQNRIDSVQILKKRFANGEMTQEEFTKMKQVLSQS